MPDGMAEQVIADGSDPEIRAVLDEVCAVTGMGFAAVARVTDERWIAAQVLDRIEFGLNPGDELDIKTTICDDIRKSGRRVVIDHVAENHDWCTHPVPILYGFQSYASLPLFLDDGSFYGTLCAIDTAPRLLSDERVIEALEALAAKVAVLLSKRDHAASSAAN